MTAVLNHLVDFVFWLFFSSLKATVVIALILIVQTAFHRRLSATWLHALWFLLIVRLIIPVDIPSPFSIFNLTDNVEYSEMPIFAEPIESHPFDMPLTATKVKPQNKNETSFPSIIKPKTKIR